MDTPERSKNGGTPRPNFEDSPTFIFYNTLSPLQQPGRSGQSAQSFQYLSLGSVASVFSTPHLNPQKDSRILIRHQLSESSKPETSADGLIESNICPVLPNEVKLLDYSPAALESCNITCALNEATVEPPDEYSSQPSNLTCHYESSSQASTLSLGYKYSSQPSTLPHQYDCGSPNHNTTPCYGVGVDVRLDNGHMPVKVAQFVQDGGDDNQVWESLLCDVAEDKLPFDPSDKSAACMGQYEKLKTIDGNSLTSSSRLPDVTVISQVSFAPCLQNAAQDPPVGNNGEAGEQQRTDHTPQVLSGTCQNQLTVSDETWETGNETSDCIPLGCKADSQQQRGMRRRCLVFGGGESRKSLNNKSNLNPSVSLPSDGKFSQDDRELFSLRPGSSLTPYGLRCIGLHLNTLATGSKDIVTVDPGRQLISTPFTVGLIPPITTTQKPQNKSMDVEKDQFSCDNEVRDLEVRQDNVPDAPVPGSGDDLCKSSPKKKKRKSDNGGESEGCKRCNCKKSKCLKLYCECFAAGNYCVEPCSCQGCWNKPIYEDTVLATRTQIQSRNPLAFAPKVIPASEHVQDMGEETNKTPASARHKRGCNCKKSNCLKKYCECYQGGVGCSASCRCEGCKNSFGRKYAEELEHEGEELDEGQQNAICQNDEHNLSENVLSIVPFQSCSPSVKLPFSCGKPPWSSSLSVGHSASQTLRKCDVPLPQSKTGKKHCKALPEDDIPEILRDGASPNNGVKTASPNQKRVSPPHNGIRMSPSCKGGRRVILKSIPPFPSLNNDGPN